MSTSSTREVEDRLVSDAFLVDPYPTLELLQSVDPVHWSPTWGVWVVSRHQDVMAGLRGHQTFSNAGRFASLLDRLPMKVQPQIGALRRHYATGIIQSDPPTHTRLRLLIRDAFAPSVIDQLRPYAVALADQLIDAFNTRGSVELMSEFAYGFPMTVMCDLLGVPREDQDRFIQLDAAISGVQSTGAADGERALLANRGIEELESYFRALILAKRRRRSDDLIGRMLAAERDNNPLSDRELMAMCVSLLLGGHETTRNLIGSAVAHIWTDPTLLARLRSNPSDVQATIEEVLRFQSPIQRAWRRATSTTVMCGRTIEAGELVYLMIGAANRDSLLFAQPSELDVERNGGRNLAFGFGIHFCIGATLARLEAAVAVDRLIARIGEWSVDRPLTWTPSVHQRGLASLRLNAPSIDLDVRAVAEAPRLD